MGLVAVTTVLDHGGAESIVAMLDQRGIPATIQRVPRNSYLGAATLEVFEVRVPAEHLDDARAALAHAEEEQPPADAMGWDRADAPETLPPSLARTETAGATAGTAVPEGSGPPRHPRLRWLLPIVLLSPIPLGCLYARWTRLGHLLTWTGLAAFALSFFTGQRSAAVVLVLAKAIDTCAAPALTSLTRRAQGGPDRVRLGASLSAALTLLLAAGAGFSVWVERLQALENEAIDTFYSARAARTDALRRGATPPAATFPDTPLGRRYAALYDAETTFPAQTDRLVELYTTERDAWARMDAPTGAWLDARRANTAQLLALIDAITTAASEFKARVERDRNHDEATKRAFHRHAQQTYDELPGHSTLDAVKKVGAIWKEHAERLARGANAAELQELATRQRLATDEADPAVERLRAAPEESP